MDMQLVAYLHPTLPWNNLDELSSLWAVFTKCKSQLRNGFRLENLTWRLWYRQAVMHKQNAPPHTIIEPPSQQQDVLPPRSLSRSQSLPDLRVPRSAPVIAEAPKQMQQSNKFFIDDYDDEDDDEEYSVYDENDEWFNHSTSSSTVYSSTASSVTSLQDDMFSKQQVNCAGKPTSMLSSMLLQQQQQQQQQQHQQIPQQTQEKAPMLRRCKALSQQLDSWFSTAA